MALAFRKVKRMIRMGKDQGKEKYFALARMVSVTPLDEVCELVAVRSSMSSADVKSIIDSLCWVTSHELKGGRLVQLGELGNFRLTVSANGVDFPELVKAHTIRKARVVFAPGALLRETCQKVSFVPFEEVIVEKEVEKPAA